MTNLNYTLKINGFELTILDGNDKERHKYAPMWGFSGWFVTYNGEEDCIEVFDFVGHMVSNHLPDRNLHGFNELVNAFKAAAKDWKFPEQLYGK